jgi:hypothetical protein
MQHQVGDFAGRKGLSIHWQAWMPAAVDMPAACVLSMRGYTMKYSMNVRPIERGYSGI